MRLLSEVIVSPDADGKATGSTSVASIVLFAVALLLPAVHVGLFGWIYFMTPLMVLFYMYRWRHGLRFIGAGLILALITTTGTGAGRVYIHGGSVDRL